MAVLPVGGTRRSRAPRDVAGRNRTCGAPRFRRALYRAELRPRASGASPSIHLPCRGDRRSGAWASVLCRVRPVDGAVFHATRSPFDPGSSTSGCASATGRRPTWRGSGARPSVRSGKLHGPYILISPCIFSRERVEPFSLERGLDSISCFFKLGITSFSVLTSFASETTKATHRVALEKLLCASDLAHLPLHEGLAVPRPEREARRRMPDGLTRSGIGRLGGGRGWLEGIQHGLVPFRVRE